MRAPSFLRTALRQLRVLTGSVAVVLACGARILAAPQPSMLEAHTLPATPLIEAGRSDQLLNFDFVIQNRGSARLRLTRISMSAYDAAHRLISTRMDGDNGFPSFIETIPNRIVEAKGVLGIFNPFYAFPKEINIDSLLYQFFFSSNAGTQHVSVTVRPRKYLDQTALRVPLSGHLLILDGHDFYSHHRRQDLSDPAAAQAGVTANPVRYAMDFVYIDATGAMYHGDSRDKRNWLGYGKPVYAPGAGRIVERVTDVPEPSWDGYSAHARALPKDASPFGLGNYLIIDHGNGEFSLLAHLIPGSISVKPGQLVTQGQFVGRLGCSDAGDPTFPVEPHLHYMLMSGRAPATSEGLPAYLGPFVLLEGSLQTPIGRGALDTGDIIDAP